MAGQLSPADVIELTRLTARYAHAIDRDQPELLRDVFTEDAIIEFHLLGDAPTIRFEGLSSFLDRPGEPCREQHLLSNHEFEADGDGATGSCYLQARQWRAEDPADRYVVGGRYEDRYRRLATGWRIAERRCYFMWAEGNPAVLFGEPTDLTARSTGS